ncbi:MAG: zinc ribbon domain-containing protein [Pseudomonadota bacterium]|nr:zinc ribbon domain-containing protein [Pseudomonadota bacterium]
MTKHCSVCATENRDEAQFCRSCGTAMPSAAGAVADEAEALAAGIACAECSFQNKPGVRYCANCGVSLLSGTVAAAATSAPVPTPGDDPFGGFSASPPPLSYPSYAAVPPYPAAPAEIDLQQWAGTPAPDTDVGALSGDVYAVDTSDAARHDAQAEPPDIADADADAAIAPSEQAVYSAENAFPVAASNRAPIIIGTVVALLLAAGAGAWWFMKEAAPTTPTGSVVSMPPPTAMPPVTAQPAPATAIAAPPVLASSMPLSTVAPGEVIVSPSTPSVPVPTTVAADPPIAPPVVDTVAEAKRLAAEKLRHEKAAREKSEREAKAKAQAEQRERDAAAASRAEQDALARRRIDDAARARGGAPVATTPTPTGTQVRGVREMCAGRGTIAESICQSRECGASEHAHEVVCRQIRERDEQRRNYTN